MCSSVGRMSLHIKVSIGMYDGHAIPQTPACVCLNVREHPNIYIYIYICVYIYIYVWIQIRGHFGASEIVQKVWGGPFVGPHCTGPRLPFFFSLSPCSHHGPWQL